jgi:hypothetical protein
MESTTSAQAPATSASGSIAAPRSQGRSRRHHRRCAGGRAALPSSPVPVPGTARTAAILRAKLRAPASCRPGARQCPLLDRQRMASRKGFEPLTYGLGNRCSILLSYRDPESAEHDLACKASLDRLRSSIFLGRGQRVRSCRPCCELEFHSYVMDRAVPTPALDRSAKEKTACSKGFRKSSPAFSRR